MSDTPRTDEENMELYDGHSYLARTVEAVPVEFVRNLERESDKLAKQCVKNVEEIGQLRIIEKNYKAELTRLLDKLIEAKKDAKRLEWLVKTNGTFEFQYQSIHINYALCRDGIDELMKQTGDGGAEL